MGGINSIDNVVTPVQNTVELQKNKSDNKSSTFYDLLVMESQKNKEEKTLENEREEKREVEKQDNVGTNLYMSSLLINQIVNSQKTKKSTADFKRRNPYE